MRHTSPGGCPARSSITWISGQPLSQSGTALLFASMLLQGYDISFLVTNTHTEEMQKHKLVDFIVRFMEVRLARTCAARRILACHFSERAGLTAEVEVILLILCLLANPQGAGSILRFPAIGNNLVSASSKVVLSRGRDGRARAKLRAGQTRCSTWSECCTTGKHSLCRSVRGPTNCLRCTLQYISRTRQPAKSNSLWPSERLPLLYLGRRVSLCRVFSSLVDSLPIVQA